jgi:PAS domain S-box-containing protein
MAEPTERRLRAAAPVAGALLTAETKLSADEASAAAAVGWHERDLPSLEAPGTPCALLARDAEAALGAPDETWIIARCETSAQALEALGSWADDAFVAGDAANLGACLVRAGRAWASKRQARRFEQALDAVSDAVEVHDAEGRLRWANRAFEAMSGHKRTDIIGQSPRELMRSPQQTQSLDEEIATTLGRGEVWRGSTVGIRGDGHAVEQIVAIHPLGGSGSVHITQFLIPALHGGSTAETTSGIAALVSSEQRFRTMMSSAGDAILIHDFESARAIDVNPAACLLFGYAREEFLTLTGSSLGGPEAAESTRRMSASLRATGHGHEPRHPMRRKDGTRFVADVRITMYEFFGRKQYLVIVRDVTEQVEREKELERSNRELSEAREQLLHSARLAALGQMAASVAHEINNPLQYMTTGVESIRERSSRDASDAVSMLEEGIDRIRSVTRALLPFSRVEPAREEFLKLTDVVDSVWRMTSTLIRHRARFEVDIPASLLLRADRTRLAQLLTNLVTNAAHAIDEGAADRNLILVRAVVTATHVVLSVSDTGRGISKEHQAHVFEPFFTTKAREAGTGLGLSLCQDIARQHDGTMRLVSEVGVGSTFFVDLPRSRLETPSAAPASPSASPQLAARVLVIDDEALVAESFRMFLKNCDVETAIGGAEGLSFLEADQAYDIILCDLMMPGVDGPTVYETVAKRWPGLEMRMIFCSGGAFTPRARTFLAETHVRLLDKPISSRELATAIAEVLDAR